MPAPDWPRIGENAAIVGTVTLVRMPVDLFPPINIPVVVVATFYSGMPPQQIETNITNPFERFFTLASGVDHIESRSVAGVSLIKIYFQPGTNADADLSSISNLAMADLRRLPPGIGLSSAQPPLPWKERRALAF